MVDIGEVGIAMIVGGLAGATLPGLGISGTTTVGAVSNVGQYIITSYYYVIKDSPCAGLPTVGGIIQNAVWGAIGGRIGGAYSPIRYIRPNSTLANQVNDTFINYGANSDALAQVRVLLGGSFTNGAMQRTLTRSPKVQCPCN